MLSALSIRDIVLIEALDLDFTRGLAALTGETGAGKSILLDALGLALGRRADSGLVRVGTEQAIVTATFDPPADHPAHAILAEAGLEIEPGEPLIVRRQVKADGGSRAWLNGQPAPAAALRTLGDALVEVHGQHDDRGMLDARGHRDLLDAFGRIDRAAVAAAHRALVAATEARSAAQAEQEAAARDREWLDHAADELAALAPMPGEEQSLADRRASMQKGARLAEELAQVSAHLDGSDGALAALRQAARRLDRMAGEHPLLADALAALDRALIEAGEADDALAAANEALMFDPARLEADEARLFELRAVARKHRVQPDDLAALAADLAARRARIEAGGEGLAALGRAEAAARADYDAAAAALSAAREAAARRLDEAVAAELAPLKLDAARFRTDLRPAAEGGPAGRDRVEFLISTNPGAPFAPLTKIASGGELSRFILALKVALVEQGAAGTMIFDEIDRGVGGAVASAIGERLARLAARAQILVVTHSPQVAARADRQYLIAKASDGTVTRTSVVALDETARAEEIARMLSGAEVTEEARAQARRLLAAA